MDICEILIFNAMFSSIYELSFHSYFETLESCKRKHLNSSRDPFLETLSYSSAATPEVWPTRRGGVTPQYGAGIHEKRNIEKKHSIQLSFAWII